MDRERSALELAEKMQILRQRRQQRTDNEEEEAGNKRRPFQFVSVVPTIDTPDVRGVGITDDAYCAVVGRNRGFVFYNQSLYMAQFVMQIIEPCLLLLLFWILLARFVVTVYPIFVHLRKEKKALLYENRCSFVCAFEKYAISTATIQYLCHGRVAQIILLFHQLVQICEMLPVCEQFGVQCAVLIVVGAKVFLVTPLLLHTIHRCVVPGQISIIRK